MAAQNDISEEQQAKEKEKHMWLGYGNYGGHPSTEINAGLVRSPATLDKFLSLLGFEANEPSLETGRNKRRRVAARVFTPLALTALFLLFFGVAAFMAWIYAYLYQLFN